MSSASLPDSLVAFGPDANCTLETCPVSASVYEYRPSLGANIAFVVLFAISMVICIVQSLRWRSWGFLFAMFWGYVCEMVGYGGRIMLHQNPFVFSGFLIQIILITIGPAFYSAAIYLTLTRIVNALGPEQSRFNPKAFYWIFIPCDIISLTLQAAGGALSTVSSGSSKTGVDIAIAGLSFQVFTLTVFVVLVVDYVVLLLRWCRTDHITIKLSPEFKLFAGFLALAIVLILVRCVYRIDELSNGYYGALIHDQGLFIGLEGVMIIVAAFCLNVAHPGPVFGRPGMVSRGKSEPGNVEFSGEEKVGI